MTSPASRIATALIATFATLPAQTGPEAGATAPPPVVTSFAWQIPATVAVTEDSLEKGRSSKLHYRLAMTGRDGGGFKVHYRDFRFVELMGRDVTSPAMQQQLAPATAMASAIPDLLIGADGTFERADGTQQCMERVVEFMAKQRGMDDAERERLRKAMTTPVMLAVLADSSSRCWNCWVGAWIGCSVQAGTKRTETRAHRLLGSEIEAEIVSSHRRDDATGLATIQRTASFDGQPFARSMLAFMTELAPHVQMSGDLAKAEQRFEVSHVETYTVVTDPKTLLPRSATLERKTILLDTETDEKHEQFERHGYVFDWTNGDADK